jgi:hypothetical protein
MSRKRANPVQETPTVPAVAVVPVIHEHTVFTAATFRETFGLRPSSLRTEVREGRLKVQKRCGRYFILGEAVLAWLREGEYTPRPRRAEGGDHA